MAALLSVGCGGSGSLGTVPVTGSVTLDGEPVEGASVVFSPVTAEGRAAAAKTGPDGKFKLTTQATDDGAVPGSYKVAITKYDREIMQVDADETDMDALYGAAEAAGTDLTGSGEDNLGAPQNLLPEKYKSPNTSGFDVEVQKDGENNFTLELQS